VVGYQMLGEECYITIASESHCRRVQEYLFLMGYSWRGGFSRTMVNYLFATNIYLTKDGTLLFSDDGLDTNFASDMYELNLNYLIGVRGEE